MKWNAELYDDKHSFVFQYGESVLELLDIKQGEQIIDLGCGTGHLTKQIKDNGAEVTGIDASAEMIEKAEKEFPGVDFRVADGANFHFNSDGNKTHRHTILFSSPFRGLGGYYASTTWFSGRKLRTVLPVCHISLSRNSFNSASSFSR